MTDLITLDQYRLRLSIGVGGGLPGDSRLAIADFSAYDNWNDALIEEFFSGRFKGRAVYLDFEPDVIERVSDVVGVDPESAPASLAQAVHPTLYLVPYSGTTFRRHFVRALHWSHDRSERPPFIALLGFFALVAESMVRDERFRANMFYGRLCDVLALTEPRIRKKVERDYRDETRYLWALLNQWLADASGNYGLPTAKAFDWRTHVSVPISQALVRRDDRQKFHDFFRAYRLDPGEHLSSDEMSRLLDEWLPNSAASPTLKRLWSQREAKERIAEVATVELESWVGDISATDGEGHVSAYPLLLAVRVRQHPVPMLLAELRARDTGHVPVGTYELAENSSESSRRAVGASDSRVSVESSLTPGWLELRREHTSLADVLIANIKLQHEAGEVELARSHRRLIPLRFDPELALFVEASRVTLGERFLVLAHESMSETLIRTLDRTAAEGYRLVDSARMRGLPEGWIAALDVTIVDVEAEYTDDTLALAPIASTSLAFQGGLPLGRHAWHSACPPVVAASARVEDVSLAIVKVPTHEGEAEDTLRDAPVSGTCVVDLASMGVDDGDYRALLTVGTGARSRVVQTATIRLRSAGYLRVTESIGLMYHLGGDAMAALSADADRSLSVPHSQGGLLTGEVEIASFGRDVLPPAEILWAVDEWDDEILPEFDVRARDVETPSCLVGGHYFLIESVAPGSRTRAVAGICKKCGLERWYPTYLRRARDRGSATRDPFEGRPRLAVSVPRPVMPDLRGADVDTIFDALSYLGAGTWPLFARLADEVNDAPWFASRLAKNLCALGHIDVALDQRTLRPASWSVSPAALVVLPDNARAVLAGFRSRRLIEAARGIAARLSMRTSLVPQEDAPSALEFSLGDNGSFDEFAQRLSESTKFEATAQRTVPQRLAQLLPDIDEIASALPESLPWAGRGERFDFQSGQWGSAARVEGSGVYRLPTYPPRYVVAKESDQVLSLKTADARTAKYVGASSAGAELVAFDRSRSLLVVPLGAELPGLFDRAATLCSGRVPTRVKTEGAVVYADVPEEVAAALYARTRPGPRREG